MVRSTYQVAAAAIRWSIAVSLLLTAGALCAQTETTETSADTTCPYALNADGTCAHHGGVGPMAMFEGMVDELALTAPQKQEMLTLMQMYQPRIKEVLQRGGDSRRALLEIAPDDPAYNVLANEVGQQAGASASEMVALMTELQANAYALLTTEQQAKFMAMRAEQRQRMEQRKAEMQARREAGEPLYGPGFRHGAGGHHECKACAWLAEDDKAQESEATQEPAE